MGFRVPQTWVRISAPPPTSWVTLGPLLYFSRTYVPHLQSEKMPILQGVVELNGVKYVEHLPQGMFGVSYTVTLIIIVIISDSPHA